ncbi:MAG: UMP kinase [Gammaproteobacteria bacterium]|nr:UMP kinase [Gammaproteobacteria bacterium]NNJ90291.1 UMP kinase [Gammaproteobacteria bacterium]
MTQPAFKRILLKLSGEALMGGGDYGIEPKIIYRLASEVKEIVETGVQVAIVIGGGNIFRGAGLAQGGMNRVTGDHMGMLATVMNSLAMGDALKKIDCSAVVMSALDMPDVCETFTQRGAINAMQEGKVAILSAGTGNPYFTTDSAASLRAVELNADVLIKATKVDGVYTADPLKDPSATMYDALSYDQVIAEKLAVMDTTAIVLCRDNAMKLRVTNIFNEGALMKLIQGESLGTLVS